jgi:hypothetical protein
MVIETCRAPLSMKASGRCSDHVTGSRDRVDPVKYGQRNIPGSISVLESPDNVMPIGQDSHHEHRNHYLYQGGLP